MGLPQSGPFLFRSGGGGGSASGSSGINYLSAIYAGDTTTNINTYNDGASSTPTNGTGGVVAGLTTALNTTTPLVGTSCVRFSKDASNRQGEGWSYDFTVDDISSDSSQPVFIQFYYRTSANYASSDLRVFVYDVTNSTLLNVQDISNNSGNIIAAPSDALFTGVFYTVSASSSYRLIWHITSTNASAYDFDIDNFVASPQGVVPGAIVADYGTETWTDSWANSTTSVKLLRIGNRVFARGISTITGAGDTNFAITVPAAYTGDSSYNFTQASNNVGMASLRDTGTDTFIGSAVLTAANTLTIYAIDPATATNNWATLTSTNPFTWTNGDFIFWEASWFVSGWSASAALSTTEALFSTGQFTARKSGTQTISSASPTKVTWTTPSKDNLNGWDSVNNRYTVAKSGRWNVDASLGTANVASEIFLVMIYVNGSEVRRNYFNGTTSNGTISAPLDLNKGDYIEIWVDSSADTSYDIISTDGYTWFSVTEDPNFSIFSTYGQFELITATSSVKTPSATNNYHQLTGNSLTLTPGTWKLQGSARFASSGSPAYTFGGIGFFGANGADTSSIPAALSTVGTVLSSSDASVYGAGGTGGPLSATGIDNMQTGSVIFRTTSTVTVYIVSISFQTTAANARITVYANAERLQ